MKKAVFILSLLLSSCFAQQLKPPAISDIREDMVRIEYETVWQAFAKPLTPQQQQLRDDRINHEAQTACERYGERVVEALSDRICTRRSYEPLSEKMVCSHNERLFACVPKP